MKMIKKPRYDLDKQEALVQAIWDFARTQQHRTHNCESYPLPHSSEGDVRCRQKVTVNMEGVGEAIDRILEIFEYDKIEIQ